MVDNTSTQPRKVGGKSRKKKLMTNSRTILFRFTGVRFTADAPDLLDKDEENPLETSIYFFKIVLSVLIIMFSISFH
jgi:hypothetical protein